VVLISPEEHELLVPILKSLEGMGINGYGLKIGDNWENLSGKKLQSYIKQATHFLIVVSKTSVKTGWLNFSVGYALGAELKTALYRTDPFWSVPTFLSSLPVIDTHEELELFYQKEKEDWISEEKRDAARSELLGMGISVHSESLAYCVKEGDYHAVKLFLDAGFPPDSRDKNGVPVLCLAVRSKHKGIVELLLVQGADVNKQAEDRGFSALMDAVSLGNDDLALYLLDSGANTELLSKDGQTALVIAVGRNAVSTSKLLLSYGANPDTPDKLGFTARKYAKLFHNSDMVVLFPEPV